MHVDPQREHRRDDNIDADVKLVAVEEERVGDELLDEDAFELCPQVSKVGLQEASLNKPAPRH